MKFPRFFRLPPVAGKGDGISFPARLAAICLLCAWARPASAAPASQTLRNHVLDATSHLKPIGRLPATQRLDLAIALPLRNQPALSALLDALYDPSSPRYRRFLTTAEFTARFGPTQADYDGIAAFARAHGLAVTHQFGNRVVLDVSGAVADIERTLHTTFRVYNHPAEHRTFYAPDVEPTLDTAIPVLHIAGLDNYALPRPRFRRAEPGARGAVPHDGSGPNGTYMGYDFRAAYAPGVTLAGTGQIVGLLEFDGYSSSDITYYENLCGLPDVPLTNVLIDGFNGQPSGDDAEICLDIQMVISMAPGLAGVRVYEGGSWDDNLNTMATDNLAKTISCSWGGDGAYIDPTADQIFQEMAAQGQTFFNASGDSDAEVLPIEFPGDDPWVVQVGGATLTTTGSGGAWTSETVWNWGGGAGSSGGISTQYGIPSWQAGVDMSFNLGSTTMRNAPDVAMTADNIFTWADGVDQSGGGTSYAAPLWAGFAALIDQQAAQNGLGPAGFICPAIYALCTGTGYAAAFHNITTGNNCWAGSPLRYSAGPGYNLCTGWGTPAGQPLINALAGLPVPAITATGSFPNAIAGASYSQALAAAGGALPYTYSVVSGALPAGLMLSGSTISGRPVAVGTSSFTIQVSDSNRDISTAAFQIAVYSSGTPIIGTAGALANGAVGRPYGQTLTASGGTKPYGWAIVSGTLAPGLGLNASSGVLSGTPAATGTFAFSVKVTGNDGLASATPFSLLVPALPAITSSLAATGTNGAGFGYQITAGNSPTGFAASGLPAGLSVDPIYGVIYGVPAAAGAFNATIAAINSGGANFKTLAITIAQMPAPTIQAAFTTLHNFAFAEGANPACGLSTGADGNLYGAAQNGGYYWYGSLFKITPSGILTTLQSFDSTDGQTPSAPPIQAATGNFYGATEDGGANGGGEIYELTSSGSLNVLYSFGGTYGAPADPLLNGTDGNLWGTSQTGGSHDAGSIFKITPAGSFTTEHSFNTGGTNPVGGLITGTDGNLYGTTEWGGTDGDGTVFKMSYRGTFTTLVNFNWSNGAYPLSGLIQASDGNFYGAANSGGLYGAGAVFKMTASGSVSDLCSFTGTYGEYPVCGVIQGQDGNFYGTTIGGGANGYGTIYSVTPGGTLTVLHSFSGSDGGLPEGSLVQLSNGVMYGATSQGGGGTYGTVYAVSPMTVRGQAGSAFSYEINAVSNTAPSSYTATGLPAGLSVNSSTGLISGTPVNAGTTTVTISATNPGGTGAGPLVIAVAPGPPVITSAASVTGTCGDAFDYPVTAGGSPSRYNETGLPPGLSISASTGVISGTPSAAGTYQATISAGNTLGAGSAGLSLTIKAAFAGWQSQWFTSAQLANPSISAEFAAAAGDGIPNLLKYAFNLGPYANAAPSLPLLSHTGLTGASYLTLTYIQDIFASDITYTPQVSPDLHNWFSGSAYINVLSVTPDSDGVTERVTVQDLTPMGSAPRYMRLEVTGP